MLKEQLFCHKSKTSPHLGLATEVFEKMIRQKQTLNYRFV
jgi:hypothetical protein